MSDKAFQWSLTAVTILALVWIGAGIGLFFLPILLVIVSAIVIEAVAGVILLRYWGKDYMSRRF